MCGANLVAPQRGWRGEKGTKVPKFGLEPSEFTTMIDGCNIQIQCWIGDGSLFVRRPRDEINVAKKDAKHAY
jgi:hypothetical protein